MVLLRLLDAISDGCVVWKEVDKMKKLAARLEYALQVADQLGANSGRTVTINDLKEGKADGTPSLTLPVRGGCSDSAPVSHRLVCLHLSPVMFAFLSRLLVVDGGYRFAAADLGQLLACAQFVKNKANSMTVLDSQATVSEAASLSATLATIESMLEQARRDVAKVGQKFMTLSLQVLSSNVRGTTLDIETDDTPQPILDLNFGQLEIERLYDLFFIPPDETEPSPDELLHLRNTLDINRTMLKRVFRYYSTTVGATDVTSLTLSEFRKFLKDITVLDNKIVTYQMVDLIYVKINTPVGTEVPLAGDGSGDDANVDDPAEEKIPEVPTDERQLLPSEFIEAVVRVAAGRYAKHDCEVADKVQMLMENFVIKYAFQADLGSFRRELLLPTNNIVFVRFHKHLKAVFVHYMTLPSVKQPRIKDCWTWEVFRSFCRDARDIISWNQHRLAVLFLSVQRETDIRTAWVANDAAVAKAGGGPKRGMFDDEPDPSQPNPGTTEISFDEYCEIIGALAVVHAPDPYLPLNQRVAVYLTRDFLPCFEHRVPKLRRIALPPPVTDVQPI